MFELLSFGGSPYSDSIYSKMVLGNDRRMSEEIRVSGQSKRSVKLFILAPFVCVHAKSHQRSILISNGARELGLSRSTLALLLDVIGASVGELALLACSASSSNDSSSLLRFFARLTLVFGVDETPLAAGELEGGKDKDSSGPIKGTGVEFCMLSAADN